MSLAAIMTTNTVARASPETSRSVMKCCLVKCSSLLLDADFVSSLLLSTAKLCGSNKQSYIVVSEIR